MNWEEACNYLWETPEEDTFILRIVNGNVQYKLSINQDWVEWCAPRADNTYYLDSYKRLGKIDFCGPMQPPPSKVILKIRQMEARQSWKSLQS